MSAREAFDAAVAKMRAVPRATVEVKDWYPSDRRPYRYACLTMFSTADTADALAEAGRLAIAIGGYLTMHTMPSLNISVALSRDLGEDELRPDAASVVSFPVAP